jgi:hypothetical protein
VLKLRVAEFVDSDGHYEAEALDPVAATLWRDGKVLAELPNAWQNVATSRPPRPPRSGRRSPVRRASAPPVSPWSRATWC